MKFPPFPFSFLLRFPIGHLITWPNFLLIAFQEMAALIQEKVQEATTNQFAALQKGLRSELNMFAQAFYEGLGRQDTSSSKGLSSSRCLKHQLQECSLCPGSSKQGKTKHTGNVSGKKNFPKFDREINREDEDSSRSEEASSDEEVQTSRDSSSDGEVGGEGGGSDQRENLIKKSDFADKQALFSWLFNTFLFKKIFTIDTASRLCQGITGAKRFLPKAESHPKLILDPDVSSSWLFTQDSYENDPQGTWSATTKFPTNPLATPPSCKSKPAKIFDRFAFKQEWLGDLLLSKPIKEVNFDPRLGKSVLPKVNTSTHYQSHLDKMIRSSLVDTFFDEQLLRVALELVGTLDIELRKSPGVTEALTNASGGLWRLLYFLLENNSRISNTQINSFICNKLGFRERVLSGYSIPNTTRWILKNSDFASEDLFGALPDTFRGLLLDPVLGPSIRMSKKSWSSGTSSTGSSNQSSSGGLRGGWGGDIRGKKKVPVKSLKRPAVTVTTSASKKTKGQHNFSRAKSQKKGK